MIAVIALVTVFFAAIGLLLYKLLSPPAYRPSRPQSKTYPPLDPDAYDIAIVGSGPSGATCAYYAVQQGLKVLLIERRKFPRDKHCGDAVCTPALDILEEMKGADGNGSVLDEIMKAGEGHPAAAGGMVSPSGFSYIGNSVGDQQTGRLARSAVIAIKRIHLDTRIAHAARKVGAQLVEMISVDDASLDKEKALWTISCSKTSQEDALKDAYAEKDTATAAAEKLTYKARVLVCADGAPSALAMKLGIVKSAPQGTCSRAYVQGGTHNLDADGIVFYPTSLLPGYAALFRHPNDELNFCTYIIPGNPKVQNADLHKIHHDLIANDPNVSRALGPNHKIERMKAGSLRLGGVPKSFDEQVIVIGDAAGHIDPLTGEGIHHAMEGGKMAADILAQAKQGSDFSAAFLENWHRKWYAHFGWDFNMSLKMAVLLYKFPILLDAATKAIENKGDEFLAEWAKVMCGQRPKTYFFRPDVVFAMSIETVKLLLNGGAKTIISK